MPHNSDAQKDKLTRWDADWYKTLSSEDCIVCLTEQQVYLVGQIITQLTWANTRWIGDKSGLDFKAIAGNLEYRLADKMTCQQLTQILQQIERLQNDFNEFIDPSPDFDVNITTPNDIYTPEQFAAMGVATDGCDTTDKDAIYGAVKGIVDYIHQANIDALQELRQLGNLADQLARLVQATPIGLLPFDEAIDYANFFLDQLLNEYEAIVDEELLQNVVCDLFCIAIANGCSLTTLEIMDYFGRKVSAGGFVSLVEDLANVMQFALSGTFTGDDFFYYCCFFQMLSRTLGQIWFGARDFEYYAVVMNAGLNSPDNDWTLFCTDCPEFAYWVMEWDFDDGVGQFVVTNGTFANGRVESEDAGSTEVVIVYLPFSVPYVIQRMAAFVDGNTHIGNGSFDFERYSSYENSDASGTESLIRNQAFITANGDNLKYCTDSDANPTNVTGLSVRFYSSMSDTLPESKVALRKVRIIGSDNGNGKPQGAYWVETAPLCADFTN